MKRMLRMITRRLSMISRHEVSWRNLTQPRFRSVTWIVFSAMCKILKPRNTCLCLLYCISLLSSFQHASPNCWPASPSCSPSPSSPSSPAHGGWMQVWSRFWCKLGESRGLDASMINTLKLSFLWVKMFEHKAQTAVYFCSKDKFLLSSVANETLIFQLKPMD